MRCGVALARGCGCGQHGSLPVADAEKRQADFTLIPGSLPSIGRGWRWFTIAALGQAGSAWKWVKSTALRQRV